MKLLTTVLAAALAALGAAGTALAQDNKLRLLTWADYAPKAVVDQFTKETGIAVEITLSNNEEMISKLRATGGAGFDLAQPSQDRITGPQQEFGIYKPLDLAKLKSELEVVCPCCQTTLVVDLNLGRVISHHEPERGNKPELSDAQRISGFVVLGVGATGEPVNPPPGVLLPEVSAARRLLRCVLGHRRTLARGRFPICKST